MPHLSPDDASFGSLDRRLAIAAFLAMTATLTIPGCAKKADATGEKVLKVGDQRGATHALLAAAGLLDDAPYKIEWVLLPAAAPLIEALSAGAIDVGSVGGPPFAFAYGNGAPIKAVLASRLRQAAPNVGKSSAIIVSKGSPLRTLADLRGRKLATIRGSSGHDVALRLLEEAKIDPKSVEFVYLNNDDAKAALAAGHIDAWSTWGAYVGIAVEENGDRVLADARQIVAKGRLAGLEVASDAALRDKSDLLRDFLGRLVRARDWAHAHPDAYVQQVAKETGVPLKVATYNIAAVQATYYTPIDATLIADQRRTLDRFLAAGVIEVLPKSSDGGFSTAFNDLVRPAASLAQGQVAGAPPAAK